MQISETYVMEISLQQRLSIFLCQLWNHIKNSVMFQYMMIVKRKYSFLLLYVFNTIIDFRKAKEKKVKGNVDINQFS